MLHLDTYPFGSFLEIEGSEKDIWETARLLGLKKSDAIDLNADQCYLEWNRNLNLKELWHVRFGLTEKFEKPAEITAPPENQT